jgi:hypothetical protein
MIPFLNQFLLGGTVAASAIAGLFFFRFWMKLRDRLFLLFALALWLMALNWLALGYYRRDEVDVPLLYVLRLVAFLLILAGIIDKNRAKPA